VSHGLTQKGKVNLNRFGKNADSSEGKGEGKADGRICRAASAGRGKESCHAKKKKKTSPKAGKKEKRVCPNGMEEKVCCGKEGKKRWGCQHRRQAHPGKAKNEAVQDSSSSFNPGGYLLEKGGEVASLERGIKRRFA